MLGEVGAHYVGAKGREPLLILRAEEMLGDSRGGGGVGMAVGGWELSGLLLP